MILKKLKLYFEHSNVDEPFYDQMTRQFLCLKESVFQIPFPFNQEIEGFQSINVPESKMKGIQHSDFNVFLLSVDLIDEENNKGIFERIETADKRNKFEKTPLIPINCRANPLLLENSGWFSSYKNKTFPLGETPIDSKVWDSPEKPYAEVVRYLEVQGKSYLANKKTSLPNPKSEKERIYRELYFTAEKSFEEENISLALSIFQFCRDELFSSGFLPDTNDLNQKISKSKNLLSVSDAGKLIGKEYVEISMIIKNVRGLNQELILPFEIQSTIKELAVMDLSPIKFRGNTYSQSTIKEDLLKLINKPSKTGYFLTLLFIIISFLLILIFLINQLD